MKYCTKCGQEIADDAVFCTACGCTLDEEAPVAADGENNISGLKKAAKILMIVGTIITSLYCFLIPLAWCIPMTLSYSKKIKNGEPVSVGFKVCTLLFVSGIAGILMLCDRE